MTAVKQPVAGPGAGSWGTALSIHLARIGHDVRLWARDARLAAELSGHRTNPVYLPDIGLPDCICATSSLAEALDGCMMVIAAVPSHGTRQVIRAASPFIAPNAILVSATKGLEMDSLLRPSEVVRQEAPSSSPVVVLSGPSFAVEVAHERPTAISVASGDADAAAHVQRALRGPYFRLYSTDDVVGVEIRRRTEECDRDCRRRDRGARPRT